MIVAVATAARTKIITSATRAAETATTSRFRRYHREARCERPCVRAATGVPASQRSRSDAKAAADWYRRHGFLLQAFHADGFQLAIDRAILLAERVRLTLEHLLQNLEYRVGLERRPPVSSL